MCLERKGINIVSTPRRKPTLLAPAHGIPGFVPSQWVSETEFLALRSHPALPQAVASFAEWLIRTYSHSRMLNLLLVDRGRLLLGFYVLYLDVLPRPGTQESGATLSAVQTLCRNTGLCSAGRAASMIALMRFGGYVTQAADPNDRRRRILVPTQRLVDIYNRNWVQQFEAMAPVFPDAAFVPRWLERPSFRTEFLRALGTLYTEGFRVVEHAPVLKPAVESNAAVLMLTTLALRQINGSGRPGEIVPLSVSAIARRFSVSRAHVRNVLHVAEAASLIIHRPDAGGIVIQPALAEALLQLYGVMFILFNRSAVMARIQEERSTQQVPVHTPRPAS